MDQPHQGPPPLPSPDCDYDDRPTVPVQAKVDPIAAVPIQAIPVHAPPPAQVAPIPLESARVQTHRDPAPAEREEKRPENRRLADRVKVAAEVGLYSDSNFYTGFTEDVSEGGLFVATYDLLPIGTQLDLEFGLPGGTEFQVRGEVRWIRDPIMSDEAFPGMGVQFIDLTSEDKIFIQEFVASREPLFYDD